MIGTTYDTAKQVENFLNLIATCILDEPQVFPVGASIRVVWRGHNREVRGKASSPCVSLSSEH